MRRDSLTARLLEAQIVLAMLDQVAARLDDGQPIDGEELEARLFAALGDYSDVLPRDDDADQVEAAR